MRGDARRRLRPLTLQRLDKIEGELDGIAKDLESIGVTLGRIGAMAERFKEFKLAQKVKRTMGALGKMQDRVRQDKQKVESIREAIKRLTERLDKLLG